MAKPNRQIITEGSGGGFEDLSNLYILAQTGKKEPRVCFMPTASKDNPQYTECVEYQFSRYPCTITHLSLWNPPTKDLKSFVNECDVIYVGGGNPKCLAGLWKEFELDKIFLDAYENGVIMSGGSAGFVIWADQAISDAWGGLDVIDYLGFLPFSGCPHYSSKSRRKAYSEAIKKGEIRPGYAADDGAALHFINEQWHRSVSLHRNAKTFKVGTIKGKVHHQRLKTDLLTLQKHQENLIWNTPTFRSCSMAIEEPEEIPLLPEAN